MHGFGKIINFLCLNFLIMARSPDCREDYNSFCKCIEVDVSHIISILFMLYLFHKMNKYLLRVDIVSSPVLGTGQTVKAKQMPVHQELGWCSRAFSGR